MRDRSANLFTIPPGVAFLDTMVAALLEGRLVPGFAFADDPFAFADLTVYLPTRRAARALRASILGAVGRPVLLPRIRTLGDIDEDENLASGAALDLPPAVPPLERQFFLSRLVLAWAEALRPARDRAGLGDEEPLVPASAADAARLAASLGAILDQVGEGADVWSGIRGDIGADIARFQEITLDFLRIVTEHWPAHLAEAGRMDPGARRDATVRAEAARLRAAPPAAPVIAAGSTGSVPATAELLAAIAALPNGAVVLPGLDLGMDEASWALLAQADDDPAIAGHPQYGLRLLLDRIGAARTAITELGAPSPALARRRTLVTEALAPAETTGDWVAAGRDDDAGALAGCGIMQAANEREEALAVALVLRWTLETPGRTAALVTPDRNLARRVAVELRRWRIEVDDSGGRPLALTPPAILARIVAETILGGFDATTLLALLKHPLAGFGLDPDDMHRAARALERAVLRGPRLAPGLRPLRHAFDRIVNAIEGDDRERRLSHAQKSVSARDRAAAADLLARLEEALAPLCALAEERGPLPFVRLVAAHRTAFDNVARSAAGTNLGGDEAAQALSAHWEEVEASAAAAPELSLRDYPGFFAALMDGRIVRRAAGTDPRIHIWGALEARLQHVDCMVLGGLNEGTWPNQAALDPLLTRLMRRRLALDPPERRIGLAAHDFAQGLGHEEVWISRARRENGEPRVASRWLQRLLARAGEAAQASHRRGEEVLAWARRIDTADGPPKPLSRPAPAPPPEIRPKKLSATRIETLIRDPYAVYAERILDLRAFDAIGRLPDAAERGNLVHAILERFVRDHGDAPYDDAARARLLRIGREEFGEWDEFPEIALLWWPRFERIARWFVDHEASREAIVSRRVELKGEIPVGEHFRLSAIADRIDILADGSLAIIDYKTGAPPSNNEVLSLAPQLPLEAIVAEAGGFADIAGSVSSLAYYRLSGQGEGGEACDRGVRQPTRSRDGQTLEETIALTRARLETLIAAFAKPETQYLSRKIPRLGRAFAGDYDHLARTAEWAVAADGEGSE